jgi:hypothetical protein
LSRDVLATCSRRARDVLATIDSSSGLKHSFGGSGDLSNVSSEISGTGGVARHLQNSATIHPDTPLLKRNLEIDMTAYRILFGVVAVLITFGEVLIFTGATAGVN